MTAEERGFWFCFTAVQLALCAAVAPLSWLAISLAEQAPAVIVTAVGAALCLASVALLCAAQCAEGASCLTRLLWLRVFTAGSGACAQLAAVGLLMFASSERRLQPKPADAASVAVLTGLAAVNAALATASCVHIYNCVTAVQLSWRVAAADDDDNNDTHGMGEKKSGSGVPPGEQEEFADEAGDQLELEESS